MKETLLALAQRVKRRVLEFAIGMVAHYARFVAMAPILGAPIMSLMMAGALTQTSEQIGPFVAWLLPESMHKDFQGGLMEFSLPIAWHYRAWIFWVPVAMSVFEQVTGKHLRNVGLRAKIWLYVLLPIFGLFSLFTIVFLDVNDDHLGFVVVIFVLNGVLLGSALMGVGGLMLISLIEDKLVSGLSETKAPLENTDTKPSAS